MTIIRVNSVVGTKRIELSEEETFTTFQDKIAKEFDINEHGIWSLYYDRKYLKELKISHRDCTMKSLNFKNGDMVYIKTNLSAIENALCRENLLFPAASSNRPMDRQARNANTVTEDEVDQILEKYDGRIFRSRDSQLCQHGQGGKCVHCAPLQPYDESYMSHCDPPINFMSFHAFLRKCKGSNNARIVLPETDCKIKSGCPDHPPWPIGCCSKCTPNPITLSIQKYRHVDFVEFEHPDICNKFIDYWRKTGNQRIGFLYGRYEPYEKVPLGIKAVVSAIYEPPQTCTARLVSLDKLEDIEEEERALQLVTSGLKLQRVGWIFTHLLPMKKEPSKVKHLRGASDSYFLSAQECITAAHFQNLHPNKCKWTSSGVFGSKFVTVLVSGNEKNEIHFESYQVSDQAMCLVRDNCLVPTQDAPELGYIRESTQEQYVPDVFYSKYDKYGNDVTQLGRPLPVDFLLVTMPVSTPLNNTKCIFTPFSNMPAQFPVEQRPDTGELQDFPMFAHYIKAFEGDRYLECLSNFHVLLFLTSCEVFHLQHNMSMLLAAILSKDEQKINDFVATDEWQTVMRLTEHADDMVVDHPSMGSNPAWSCSICTLLNRSDHNDCAACGTRKS